MRWTHNFPHPVDNAKVKNFYVITVVSNPIRFKSRVALYKQFAKHVEDSNAKLITVELAYGDRPHEVTEAGNPYHLQLRTSHELWHKENLLNLGIHYIASQPSLFPDADHFAWVDADIEFVRKDWVLETWHALQHHMFVQMFSEAIDLGPDFQPIQTHKGFAWCYTSGLPFGPGYTFWHPGYAWAARREAIDHLGGLLDAPAVLGAGDHHMALALIGQAKQSMPGKIHPNYEKLVMRFQDNAEQYIKRNIGYVPGTILHYWHGKKKDRKYVQRWDLLTKTYPNGLKYDPELDLKKDVQGVFQLTDRNIYLRDAIRQYFRQRNEDSTDLE